MPRQPFHLQKSGQKSRSLKECYEELNRISGGDILSLLTTFFTTNKEGKKISSNLEISIWKKKYYQIIKNIKKKYKTSKPEFKNSLLSLVSGMSNKEIKQLFSVSSKKIAKIRAGIENKKPGRKPTEQNTKNKIAQFILDHSQPAANQTVKMKNKEGKKVSTPVQVINSSIRTLYGQWTLENKDTPLEISESTFRDNIPKNVKKARKATDLCEHCEKYDKVIREQKRIKLTHSWT